MRLPISFGQTDLGKFAKPVNTLIEKVASAYGTICKPTGTRREARAKAYARILQTKSEIEVALIERTIERQAAEEVRNQRNIESVIRKSLPLINAEAKPQDMEDDWVVNFFQGARSYSDEQMQILWAKVLAGETNAPGSFSRRTVTLLSTLDKRDAELFATVRRFCILDTRPAIYSFNDIIYRDNGVNYQMLMHLDEIGLIDFAPLSEHRTLQGLQEKGYLNYFDHTIFIDFHRPSPSLNIGSVILTKTGTELVPICDAEPVDGFIDYLKTKWKEFGIDVEPQINA